MKIIENFVNSRGVEITVYDDKRIHCKSYLGDGIQIEYTFTDEDELRRFINTDLNNIDQFDLFDVNEINTEHPDFEDFPDIELE